MWRLVLVGLGVWGVGVVGGWCVEEGGGGDGGVVEVEAARFHHVHLNVTDPVVTEEFYRTVFGAVPVEYGGRARGLFVERSFILWNVVEEAAPSGLRSGIWHIGWGGVDMVNEYRWFERMGVKIHTPLYELGRIHVTYLQGPDDELIEVNTMGHHRFAHVHLFAADVNETVGWYWRHLGLRPRREHVARPDLSVARAWSNSFQCDNVSFIVYGRPDYEPSPPWWPYEPLLEFEGTAGRVIDHVAFSYGRLLPVYERMVGAGVEVVSPIAYDAEFNHVSFFVLGPDGVLVELVEAKGIPESSWE